MRVEKTTVRQPAKRLLLIKLRCCVSAPDEDTEGPPAVGLAEARPESEKFWLNKK
jgi:hypothetical protein